MKVNLNAKNICFIEGTVCKMTKGTDKNGSLLKFFLIHANTTKPNMDLNTKAFYMKTPVRFYGRSADRVAKEIKNGDIVEVEGRLSHSDGSDTWKIKGVHAAKSGSIIHETNLFVDLEETEINA